MAEENNINPNDSGSIGWGVLGFFIPLVGLILFFVWKNTKPNCASVSLKGAIIGVIVSAICGIINACLLN